MNQMVEGNSKMNENENEEETNNNVQCIHCKQEIIGKPWITVSIPDRDEYNISCCKYLCARNLKYYIGNGYWDNVINKEDFSEPRPVSVYTIKKDITTNFGIDEIRDEINREEERILRIEEEYLDDYDDSYYSEEDIY